MSSSDRASIPILTTLIPSGIKLGKILVVEYDPESQWFAVATTTAARYVKGGSEVTYLAMAIMNHKT